MQDGLGQSPSRQLGQGTGSAAEGAGGHNQHSTSQARPRWAWGNSRSVPAGQDELPGAHPGSDREASDRGVLPPPGLEFLGREPPSAARALAPPKREALSANLVSSAERSSYFAEYRHGRVPGSPGLEQLRSQANLDGAPSHLSAGSTKWTLFPSDALQLEKELEQVRMYCSAKPLPSP